MLGVVKKWIAGLGTVILAGGSGLAITAANFEPIIPQGTLIGVIPVGGLTKEEAAKRVRLWWEAERTQTVSVVCTALDATYGDVRFDRLGMSIDDVASVEQIALDDFQKNAARTLNMAPKGTTYPLKFKIQGSSLEPFSKFIASKAPKPAPASVAFGGGRVIHKFEQAPIVLDPTPLEERIEASFVSRQPLDLPVTEGKKRIPDEELKKIVEPMAEFTTKFSASNRPRSSNIKVAAAKLNALVMMPGDEFSFNGTVGRRTVAGGFKEAGVYVNGRHDTGVGGGICQVSTTLYNAVLKADLTPTNRLCHSLPVPYVPTGQDATVSFPNPDFKFKNNAPHPIALRTIYAPGQLTVRIYGIATPGKTIEIVRGPASYRSRGEKTVHDPNLPFGKVVIEERGASQISLRTTRVVKQNGKVIRRDDLGTSVYAGSPRIIRKNLRARAPVATPATTDGTPQAPAAPAQVPALP